MTLRTSFLVLWGRIKARGFGVYLWLLVFYLDSYERFWEEVVWQGVRCDLAKVVPIYIYSYKALYHLILWKGNGRWEERRGGHRGPRCRLVVLQTQPYSLFLEPYTMEFHKIFWSSCCMGYKLRSQSRSTWLSSSSRQAVYSPTWYPYELYSSDEDSESRTQLVTRGTWPQSQPSACLASPSSSHEVILQWHIPWSRKPACVTQKIHTAWRGIRGRSFPWFWSRVWHSCVGWAPLTSSFRRFLQLFFG